MSDLHADLEFAELRLQQGLDMPLCLRSGGWLVVRFDVIFQVAVQHRANRHFPI